MEDAEGSPWKRREGRPAGRWERGHPGAEPGAGRSALLGAGLTSQQAFHSKGSLGRQPPGRFSPPSAVFSSAGRS